MMQQVNLYTAELRPRKERLQAGTPIAITLLAIVALIASGSLIRYQSAAVERQVASLENQNLALEQSLAQLSAEVGERQPDPDVQAAVQRVTDTLARRQRLLERVENLTVNSGAKFSPQMTALARQIPENVWLTGLQLDAQTQGVTLEGRASQGALVPVYLENLSNEAVFIGRTFGAFRLSRPEEGAGIEFFVASQPSREAD